MHPLKKPEEGVPSYVKFSISFEIWYASFSKFTSYYLLGHILKRGVKLCVGFPWLIGVMFDVLSGQKMTFL